MGTWDLPFISPRDCIAGKRSRSGVHVSPWGGPRPARDVRGQPLPDAAQRAWRLWGSELGMHTLAHAAGRAFPAARAGKLGKETASSQEHSKHDLSDSFPVSDRITHHEAIHLARTSRSVCKTTVSDDLLVKRTHPTPDHHRSPDPLRQLNALAPLVVVQASLDSFAMRPAQGTARNIADRSLGRRRKGPRCATYGLAVLGGILVDGAAAARRIGRGPASTTNPGEEGCAPCIATSSVLASGPSRALVSLDFAPAPRY